MDTADLAEALLDTYGTRTDARLFLPKNAICGKMEAAGIEAA
jgi:hypothetical protein